MKWRIIFTLVLLLTVSNFLSAGLIKLKITYNGVGVANNDITVKVGDAVLGKGKTDSNGDVSISAPSSFPKSIDLYGHVSTNNGEKNWDLKGWVYLNDDNYSHVKMEEVLEEMGGMGMPTSLIAEAWGLVFSTGGNARPAPATTSGSNPSSSNNAAAAPPAVVKPAEPVLPAGYKCFPLKSGDFAAKKSSVEQSKFDSDKMKAAQGVIKGSCLETTQIKELMELFTFGGDRLELAKFGYDYVANPGSYSAVESSLKMDMDRRALQDYIAKKNGGGAAPAKTQPAPAATNSNSNLPPTVPAGSNYTLTVVTEAGEPFYLTVDGVQINSVAASKVDAPWVNEAGKLPLVKVVFEDKNIPTLEKKMVIGGYSTECTYNIKQNKKGEYVMRIKMQ